MVTSQYNKKYNARKTQQIIWSQSKGIRCNLSIKVITLRAKLDRQTGTYLEKFFS